MKKVVSSCARNDFLPRGEKVLHGYSDGACKGNPGKGGWGALFFDVTSPRPLVFRECGGKIKTTNQEMELVAMIRLLQMCPLGHDLFLFTDSMYVLQSMVSLPKTGPRVGTIKVRPEGKAVFDGWLGGWIKNGWKTGKGDVKYRKEWMEMIERCEKLVASGSKITVSWVKGHSKNEGNDMADALANQGVPKS